MLPTARPAKLACLSCRASKTRCDGQKPCATCAAHQGECRYQPSRRGGARRGPVAAEELARKRAQRLAHITSVNNYERNPPVQGQGYHYQPNPSSNAAFSSSSLFIIQPGLQSATPLLNSCSSLGFPSPLGTVGDTQEASGNSPVSTWSLRAYQCDEDLINAYYVFIHPYFPFLPPPAVPQREDKCVSLNIAASEADPSSLPYWPSSPLSLAISALLALIPPAGKPCTFENESFAIRRSYANLFARSALDASENSLELSSRGDLDRSSRVTFHPSVPRKLEPVLALGLLSLFECCQQGNIPKMRVRANQALTMAMDLSLHTEAAQSGSLDAHRRGWWGTIFLVYLSSAMNASAPIITFDDPRITTNFPEFRGCREPWPLLVNAQVALLRSCYIGRQLVRKSNTIQSLPRNLGEEIQKLDYFILELAAECDRFRCITNYQGPEADASRNLWAISNALIHTSRLTLHRARAFPDRPIFHDEYCDFLAVDTISQPAHHFHLSANRIADINALFPFTEQESVKVCLHSALVISRVFRRISSPNPTYSDIAETENNVSWVFRRAVSSPRSIPYMACCQLQSFHTLGMVLWRVRTALSAGNLSSYFYLFNQPSATTEVQDAERLMEELESGMEALGRSIQADVVFEGVRAMSQEVDRVYEATCAMS